MALSAVLIRPQVRDGRGTDSKPETLMKNDLTLALATCLGGMGLGILVAGAPFASASPGGNAMEIQYLEIVTKDVDAVVAAYSAALGVQFGEPTRDSAGRAPLHWQAVDLLECARPCVMTRTC